MYSSTAMLCSCVERVVRELALHNGISWVPIRNPCRMPFRSIATHSGWGCPDRAYSLHLLSGVWLWVLPWAWQRPLCVVFGGIEGLEFTELSWKYWWHDSWFEHWHAPHRQHYWSKRGEFSVYICCRPYCPYSIKWTIIIYYNYAYALYYCACPTQPNCYKTSKTKWEKLDTYVLYSMTLSGLGSCSLWGAPVHGLLCLVKPCRG